MIFQNFVKIYQFLTKKKNEDRKRRDFCKNKLPEIYARPRVLLSYKVCKIVYILGKK